MQPIGLDIGGAHLKVSDTTRSKTVPFPLWRRPHDLAEALEQLLADYACDAPLAVTMTGELADCFETKSAGVAHILEAVSTVAASRTGPGRDVFVWQTGGEFLTCPEAREFAPLVAAANWHALATWAGRMAPRESALLIDMGSTTTDIIPLDRGVPDPSGRTDLERLASGELLYLGVRRTPLCAVADRILVRGKAVGVARELFSTMHDVWLQLGMMPEEPSNSVTSDGRPAMRCWAEKRLARMVASDSEILSEKELTEMTRGWAERAGELVRESLAQVVAAMQKPPQSILMSGEGEFLIRQVLTKNFDGATNLLSLAELVGPAHSQAACAWALAQLARERL